MYKKKIKKVIIIMVVLQILFCQNISSIIIYAKENTNQQEQRYIVLAKDLKSYQKISEKYEEYLCQDVNQLENLAEQDMLVTEMLPQQVEAMKKEKGVVLVEEDIMVYGSVKEDRKEDIESIEQWNLKAIHTTESEKAPKKRIKIALLDSGVSYAQDIPVKERTNLIPGEENLSFLFEDGNGHGTGMAGIIGAKNNNSGIDGINPNADIYSVKVLDDNLQAPISRIVEGIYWSIEHKVNIISMSFGTNTDSAMLKQAVKDAYKEGILLIAAAGNSKSQNVQYPAAYKEVVSVGSTDMEGKISEDSSGATKAELFAPGEGILTSGLFDGITETSGTSISTAQVSAAASLLWEKDIKKSADFVRKLLKVSARKITLEKGTISAFIDVTYAQKIYSDFSKSYVHCEENIFDNLKNNMEVEDFEDKDNIVNGLWKKSQHYSFGHDYAYQKGIPGDGISLMAKAAEIADVKFHDKKNGLHGGGNYLLHLKYLWTIANNLYAGNNVNNSLKKAEKAVYASKSKDDNMKSDLEKAVKELLNSTSLMTGNYPENTSSARYYKVMGFVVHLIGDTFAHRSIIPAYTLKNPGKEAIYDNGNIGKARFGKNDFKNWSTFSSKVKNELDFVSIKDYMKTMDYQNQKYEDKETFCSERYYETVDAIKYMIDHRLENFNIKMVTSRHGVKLIKFSTYKKKI